MFKDKLISTLTALFLLIGLGCIGYVIYNWYGIRQHEGDVVTDDCITRSYVATMQDELMTGIINKGQNYRVLENYFQCNPITPESIVYFKVSGPIDPVPRVVKGVPGDRFSVERSPQQGDIWHVKINGQPVMANGQRYFFKFGSIPPLKTYEKARRGLLKDDEYILFSNMPPGLSDSGNMGIIRKRQITGKIVPL